MARKSRSKRNNNRVGPMARVVVHEAFPHKFRNGSVQVLEPSPEPQTVKRAVANGLVACGRGKLHSSDMKAAKSEPQMKNE